MENAGKICDPVAGGFQIKPPGKNLYHHADNLAFACLHHMYYNVCQIEYKIM